MFGSTYFIPIHVLLIILSIGATIVEIVLGEGFAVNSDFLLTTHLFGFDGRSDLIVLSIDDNAITTAPPMVNNKLISAAHLAAT